MDDLREGILRLVEEAIEHPAAAHVDARAAAVAQDALVGAAGLLQGVGQERQPLEGPLLVKRPRQSKDVGRAPGRVDGDGIERVAEDLAWPRGLCLPAIRGPSFGAWL